MKDLKKTYMRSVIGAAMIVAAVAAGLNWNTWQATAADDERKADASLSTFMRKKLDASSQILEGLAVEDTDLIKRGADSMLQLSKAEKWQILADSDYREFSADFRKSVKRLSEAAEKNNFDNAALQWFDTMKCCIECHQHVRKERALKK